MDEGPTFFISHSCFRQNGWRLMQVGLAGSSEVGSTLAMVLRVRTGDGVVYLQRALDPGRPTNIGRFGIDCRRELARAGNDVGHLQPNEERIDE